MLSRKSPSAYPLRMAGRPPSPRRAARRAASVSSASLWWLLRIRAVFAEAILDAGRVVGTSERCAHRFNGSAPVSCWTRQTTFRRAMKHRAPQLPAQAAAARSFADTKPVDCTQLISISACRVNGYSYASVRHTTVTTAEGSNGFVRPGQRAHERSL